jgi:hypothetical protein
VKFLAAGWAIVVILPGVLLIFILAMLAPTKPMCPGQGAV